MYLHWFHLKQLLSETLSAAKGYRLNEEIAQKLYNYFLPNCVTPQLEWNRGSKGKCSAQSYTATK